ncbi:MAG: hypothetical protein AB7O47_12235 [Flavobacteriales bacterium]
MKSLVESVFGMLFSNKNNVSFMEKLFVLCVFTSILIALSLIAIGIVMNS